MKFDNVLINLRFNISLPTLTLFHIWFVNYWMMLILRFVFIFHLLSILKHRCGYTQISYSHLRTYLSYSEYYRASPSICRKRVTGDMQKCTHDWHCSQNQFMSTMERKMQDLWWFSIHWCISHSVILWLIYCVITTHIMP